MSQHTKNTRPKILSIPQSLSGIDIAVKKDILWPCHAYSISIPQKKKSKLNIFEETVLKMIAVESGDSEKLASLLCIEKELVSFIQNRLVQLDLLTDRFDLTKTGTELITIWQNKTEDDLEYISATVFMDLLSGQTLSYLHIGELAFQSIKIIAKDKTTFEKGSSGTSYDISATKIGPLKGACWNSKPTANDIVKVSREYKKRYTQYALLNPQSEQDQPPSIPKAEAISIQDSPELVYLHCQLIMQKGNSDDLLITDGFGFGFSDSFSNYLQKQDWNWITNFKRKAMIAVSGKDKKHASQNTRNKSFIYPDISKCLNRCKKSLDEIQNTENNSDGEKNKERETENTIKNLYVALEYCFRQVVVNHPVPEWQSILSSQDYKENENLLHQFAEKIGLIVTHKEKPILQVKAGAIKQIEYGKTELQPLLALAITGASNQSDHPFNHLAKQYPLALKLFLELKRLRDPIAHGKSDEVAIEYKELKINFETISDIILTLLPDIKGDYDSFMNESYTVSNEIDQDRLKAVILLEKNFTFPTVSNMEKNLKEQLLRIEMYLSGFSDNNKNQIIEGLASSMQLLLGEITQRYREYIQSDEPDNYRDQAFYRAVQYGMIKNISAIPESLSTVQKDRLARAIQGSQRESLGANFIAFLFLLPDDDFTTLDEKTKLIETVDQLITLRGHGNHEVDIPLKDLTEMKETVFTIIKRLLEI
ncbi:MAG: hypothetical protein Q9O24_00065 [Gammaproteobacteria bacterium]|nr:hypothetical protein [Gammaproteobacteria bacterium]